MLESAAHFTNPPSRLRDVIENHLFQIVALLAMGPLAGQNFGVVQTENDGIQGYASFEVADMVRGQYAGYRQERDVAKNSDVETYCALRLFIAHGDGWCAVVSALRQVSSRHGDRGGCGTEAAAAETLRRSSGSHGPRRSISLPVLSPTQRLHLPLASNSRERSLSVNSENLYLQEEQAGEEAPYERLLGDAMKGDRASLLARTPWKLHGR